MARPDYFVYSQRARETWWKVAAALGFLGPNPFWQVAGSIQEGLGNAILSGVELLYVLFWQVGTQKNTHRNSAQNGTVA